MLPPGGKEIDPLPGGAQRRLGGRLDRNPKLWYHVTNEERKNRSVVLRPIGVNIYRVHEGTLDRGI